MTRVCFASLFVLALTAGSIAYAADAPEKTAPEEPKNMQPLFKGDSLEGWDGDPRLWSVKDGVVRGETTKENVAHGNTFLIWQDGKLKDFDLRLSFRIKGGNAGVQYRAKHVPEQNKDNKWIIEGYQAEVEDTPGKAGFLYDERGRGYLCNVGEKVTVGPGEKPKVVGSLGDKDAIGATYNKSDWNDYVIIARGNHIQHFLNGVQTVDIIDNDPEKAELEGVLAFQIHAGPPMVVEYKDVRLKELHAKKEGAKKGGKKRRAEKAAAKE
ncbi:MAG: DUF1080 domain-containing protein [Planctomycetota bacterium]|nr:DUF1080 domain-containing protein [Planctomycetota bacterium]